MEGLDSRFELRNTAAGVVIVPKGERKWSAPVMSGSGGAPAGGAGRAGSAAAGSARATGEGKGAEDSEAPLRECTLSEEERLALVLSVGEECVQPDELAAMLKVKPHPVCYDGFEPSGRMHIAQGILKSILVNKLTTAGCVFKFWVADWFAMLNHKLGGDLKKIKKVGEYMVEVWKAAGMDMTNVRFLWASDEINKDSDAYWMRVMDISMRFNLTRMKKCATIMGRKVGVLTLPARPRTHASAACA